MATTVADVCTVVTRHRPDEPLRILAVRDELVSREFDDPNEWWPDRPGVVGGRDRLAGGTWCASDVARGTTALVLNRIERRTGEPSRGILPLAALEHGTAWPEHVDHTAMASFTLLLAGPAGVLAWVWDAAELASQELAPGTHMVTTRGADPGDVKTERFAARFEIEDWMAVVTSAVPEDDVSGLLVRHVFETDTYATVLGQFIDSEPGRVRLRYSRTPWEADSWTEATFS